MAICRNPNCAKENPDDLVFCKYCGRRLKEPKNYSNMPLRVVAVLAGFVILLVVMKMMFSGAPKENQQPNLNNQVVQDQKGVGKIDEGILNYKFVFSRGKGPVKEIYVYNTDGTTEQLTNSNAQNIFTSLSPDGSKITFERIENKKSNIYVINIDGSGEKKLAKGHEPTWTADGTKILFYNEDENSISEILYSIKPDGTKLTRETNTSDSYRMARVSPDGNKIAMAKYSLEGWGIYTVGPDFTGRKTLITDKNELGNPTWSKDGNLIAYQSKKHGNYDIYSVDLNMNVKRLTDSELPEISPSFTPDGKILFTREEMGTMNIYIMDSDGNNQKMILKDAGYASVAMK